MIVTRPRYARPVIDFDPTLRPLMPSEWQALVEAVYNADAEDESEWLEWKSAIDWSNKEHLGAVVAKAILGMANRPVPPPQLGGSGLIVFGLQPKKVEGIERIDPASMEEKLRPFLGQVRLPFEPRWHDYEGVSVLSIEVPPVPSGTPPFTLHKQSGKYAEGAIFVRGPGQTKLASSVQVAALVERARATVDEPISIDLAPAEGSIAQRVRLSHDDFPIYLAAAREHLMKDAKPRAKSAYDIVMPTALGGENRTIPEFKKEVDDYLAKLALALPSALDDFAAAAIPATWLQLSNRGERNYPGLRVTLYIEGGVIALDAGDEDDDDGIEDRLPSPPRRYGTSSFSFVPELAYRHLSADIAANLRPGDAHREIENGDPTIVRLSEIDLRRGATPVTIERDLVLLVPEAYEGPLVIRWEATAANLDTLASGEFSIPTSTDVIDLLRAAVEADRRKS